jgi:hypothetical protein
MYPIIMLMTSISYIFQAKQWFFDRFSFGFLGNFNVMQDAAHDMNDIHAERDSCKARQIPE